MAGISLVGALVLTLADRLMVIKAGGVVETGLTDQVLDDPQPFHATSGIRRASGLNRVAGVAGPGEKARDR